MRLHTLTELIHFSKIELLFVSGVILLFLLINKKRKIIIFTAYLIVLFWETVLNRPMTMGQINFHLFSSLFNFWNRFTLESMKMPLINLLMLIPFGKMLPEISIKNRRLSRTLIKGFLLSLLIEIIQLLTLTGVFELDDLVFNSISCLIGWCFYRLHRLIKKKQLTYKTGLILLSPCLGIIVLFNCLSIAYWLKPYGNFENGPVYFRDVSEIDFIHYSLSKEDSMAWVYKRETFSNSLMKRRAEEILKYFGLNVDLFEINKNMLKIKTSDFTLEMDSFLCFDLVFYNNSLSFNKEGFDLLFNQLVNLYSIQENQIIKINENKVTIGMSEYDHYTESGVIHFYFNENNQLERLNWQVKSLIRHNKGRIISEKKAWEKIESGWFRLDHYSNIKTMELRNCEIVYQQDTKLYYQPVYQFTVLINGQDLIQLLIPALE